jgi:hypothetical protein
VSSNHQAFWMTSSTSRLLLMVCGVNWKSAPPTLSAATPRKSALRRKLYSSGMPQPHQRRTGIWSTAQMRNMQQKREAE